MSNVKERLIVSQIIVDDENRLVITYNESAIHIKRDEINISAISTLDEHRWAITGIAGMVYLTDAGLNYVLSEFKRYNKPYDVQTVSASSDS